MNHISRFAHLNPTTYMRLCVPRMSLLLLACLVEIIGSQPHVVRAQATQSPTEADIRAAFILNFAKFTEWPAEVFADAETPLTVGFVGADDARTAFAALSTGKEINGRKIVVLQLDSVLKARQCQILFFRKSNGDFAVGALEVANVSRTLTIGEAENFLARGGMIRLFVGDNRMRFDVNVGATTRSKIRLSSKLLALAHTVVNLPLPGSD